MHTVTIRPPQLQEQLKSAFFANQMLLPNQKGVAAASWATMAWSLTTQCQIPVPGGWIQSDRGTIRHTIGWLWTYSALQQ
jgi:hypothetical protein